MRCGRFLVALLSAALCVATWIGVATGGMAAPEGSATEGKIGVVVRQMGDEAVIDFGTVSPAGSPYIKRQALGAAILSSVDGWNLTVREAPATQSGKGRRLEKGLAVRAGEGWVDVSSEERELLSGQPATGQKWRQIPIDLRLDVSWDDPPGSYEGQVVIAALPAVSAAFAAADPSPFSPNGDGIADRVRITYHLRRSSLVTARIFRDGLLVREFPPGERGVGFQVLTWDGRDDSGQVVADGEYQYRVTDARTEEVLAAGSVSVDRTAPKLYVYSPKQGEEVGAHLLLEGKTESRALITARVAATDGTRVHENTRRSQEDGSFSLRLPTFSGENIVTLLGQDQAGNRACWEMIVFGTGTPDAGPKVPARSRTPQSDEGEDVVGQALTTLSLQCHLQSTARVGDILKLRVQLSNASCQELGSVKLALDLPAGWTSLQKTGGSQLERTEFAIGRLRSGQTRLVEVPLLVGAGSPAGPVAVTARARGLLGGKPVGAGPNTQTVLVGKGPFSDRALVIGRVWHDSNRNGVFDFGEPPLSGVTLLLTDGSRVRTDDWGRYSLPGLRPGMHRISICPDSARAESVIPADKLVNLPPGGFWRVDFPLRSRCDEQNGAVEDEETRGGWHGLFVRSFTWPDDEQASRDGNLSAGSLLARHRTLISFQGQLPFIEKVTVRVSQGALPGESNPAGEERLPTGDASTLNSAPRRREGFTGSLQGGSWQLVYGGFDPGDQSWCPGNWARTLTGLHGGYRGKLGELKGFIARENSVPVRDVLPIRSAFGPYQLSRGDIIPGTEQVAVVFAGKEKSRQPLPRSSYYLDCNSGTLLFWQPLPSGDAEEADGHLEVSYQIPGGMEQAATWGVYGNCRPPGLYFEGALIKEGGKAPGELLGGAKMVVEGWNHTLTAGWDCMTPGKKEASIRWEVPHEGAEALPVTAEWQEVAGDSTRQAFTASGIRQLGKGLRLRARYRMSGTGLPARWRLCFDQYFSRHLTGQLILTRSGNCCRPVEGKATLSGDWELAGGSSLQVDVSKDCSPGQMPAPASMSIRADVAGPVALEGRIRVERGPGQPEERPMHFLASAGFRKGPVSICLGREQDGNGSRSVVLGEAKISSQPLKGNITTGLVRAGDGLPRWRASVDFAYRPRQSNHFCAAGWASWTGGAREDDSNWEFTGSIAGAWKPNGGVTASGKIDWRQTSTASSISRTFRANGRLSYRLNEYWQLSGYGSVVEEGVKPGRSGKMGLEIGLFPLSHLEIALGVERITGSGRMPCSRLVNRVTLAW